MSKSPLLVVWRLLVFLAVAGVARAESAGFTPGKIAVLRVGDGVSDFASRQNPVFIDQFDPKAASQATPSFTATVPAQGTNALFINGNAYTEGGMARSASRSVLTLAGYCGDMLSQRGTPSKLNYTRGVCVISADGSTRLACNVPKWYGLSNNKTNPRDAVTDGTNHFWGCGDEVGVLYYSDAGGVVPLKSAASVRAVKFVNNILYASIMASDGGDSLRGGICDFVDAAQAVLPRPSSPEAAMAAAIPATAPFVHVAGFDISPKGDVSYTADMILGVQKYVKGGTSWRLERSFYIPGYSGPGTGILTNSASTAVRTGCFGLAVDFSGATTAIYATTMDWVGYDGANVNSNRLIRIEDVSGAAPGATVTNFGRTLAWAPGTNICFRAIDFTPERR